jgi:Tfp pilus assembly protein PilF
LNDYGVYHLGREQWSTAESWFRRALEVQPGQSRTRINLGISLAMQGRLDESYEVFSSVVGSAAAYLNIGVLLARRKEDQAAEDYWRRALELNPTLR